MGNYIQVQKSHHDSWNEVCVPYINLGRLDIILKTQFHFFWNVWMELIPLEISSEIFILGSVAVHRNDSFEWIFALCFDITSCEMTKFQPKIF